MIGMSIVFVHGIYEYGFHADGINVCLFDGA